MKKKALKVTLITIGIILGVILLLLGGIKVGEKLVFNSFYKNATKEFKMPGLGSNLVQQGIVYIEEEDVYLVTGYMSDDTASMVYVVSKSGEVINKVALKNSDGSDYLGHTGGIEYYENNVYITEGTKEKGYDGGLDVFPLDAILTKTEATKIGRVTTFNNPSCCLIYKDYMLVGEYYKEEAYETLDSHRIETPAGDLNTSLICVFRLESGNDNFGIGKEPIAAITTTGAVQGIETIGDEQIVLSTSWGLSKSKLYFYDMSKVDTSERAATLIEGGNTASEEDDIRVEVYHLDSASLVNILEAPPMSEEMVYLDGKLFILNESASNKYIFGKFMSGNYMYAYQVK